MAKGQPEHDDVRKQVAADSSVYNNTNTTNNLISPQKTKQTLEADRNL